VPDLEVVDAKKNINVNHATAPHSNPQPSILEPVIFSIYLGLFDADNSPIEHSI
jgi:hypothetical protein